MKFLLFFLFLLSYSQISANFICENATCDDQNFENLNILYEEKDYLIAKINKDLEIENITGLFPNNYFIFLEKNNLFFLSEIRSFLEKNPSDFVILRKGGDKSTTINYALKIQCDTNSFSVISDNQKIAYKNEIFWFKNCENIEKYFLIEKIKIFWWFLFIFLWIIWIWFYIRKKRK